MQKNILITGMSGSGKSTIAQELTEAGQRALDLDEVPDLCTMYYKDSKKPVMTEFENHNLAWVQSVEWICDAKKLQDMVEKHTASFYCGSADNIDEILPIFDTVILLRADDQTFRHRLTHRTNNNWGRTKDIQDWLLKEKQRYEEKIVREDAKSIDTNQDIKSVVAEILRIARSE